MEPLVFPRARAYTRRNIRYLGRSTDARPHLQAVEDCHESGQANTKAWVLDFEPSYRGVSSR
jgi:hypothetical protein